MNLGSEQRLIKLKRKVTCKVLRLLSLSPRDVWQEMVISSGGSHTVNLKGMEIGEGVG